MVTIGCLADWIQAGEYYFPKLIFPSVHVFYVVSGGKFFVHAIDSFIYLFIFSDLPIALLAGFYGFGFLLELGSASRQ